MKIRKAIPILALSAFAAGCATTVPSNEVGLYNDDGPFEGYSCCEVIEPSSRKVVGFDDNLVTYPTDQRSWVSGIDRPPVEFVSKDGLRMTAPFELRFVLSQDPETLIEFHQEVGLKNQAWTEDGWLQTLQEFLDPTFERAIDSAGLAHNWRELRENEGVRQAFAEDARQKFSSSLENAIGGNFFCGIEHNGPNDPCGDVYVAVGQPTPVDEGVVKAIESEQAARAQTQALSAEEERATAEAMARQVLIDQLGPQLYVCLEAIEAAQVTGNAPPPCYAGFSAEPVVDVG